MVSRAERSAFSDWWWTVDRLLLAALAILILAGLVFLMAGGPPVAERLGLSTFHFVNRQVLFLLPALLILLPVSFLSLRHVRRLALLVYLVGMVLILLAIASVRLLDVYLPDAWVGEEHTWSAHLVTGSLFTLLGAVAWSRRTAPPDTD